MTNAAGATATRSIDITVTGVSNSAPTAQLSLDPANGIAPLKTSVLIGGSDRDADALTYAVDFGDGSPEEKGDLPRAAMAHTYARPGTYIARLAVSDGELSATATATVVVVPDAPLKAVAGDDQVSIVDTAVLFRRLHLCTNCRYRRIRLGLRRRIDRCRSPGHAHVPGRR